MLSVKFKGCYRDFNTGMEAVGALKAGKIDETELHELEDAACPTCGSMSSSGMFTANSMNCLCEVLGIALPGNGTIPSVYSEENTPCKTGRYEDNGAFGERYNTVLHSYALCDI